jgi:hypothetical protein
MELFVLRDYYKYENNVIIDDIEIYQDKLDGSIANEWIRHLKPFENDEVLDQYSIEKNIYSVNIMALRPENNILHLLADVDLAFYFEDFFLQYPYFEIIQTEKAVFSFEEAFRLARQTGTDYFFLLTFQETDRTFQSECKVYLTQTGALLETFKVFRTGNNRIKESISELAFKIKNAFPLKAYLMAREFNEGLINLGRWEGIKEDDVFKIVKKGRLNLLTESIGLKYLEEDILGEFKVTKVDEYISEGIVIPKGFFDLINPGDELFLLPGNSSAEE